MKATTFFAAVAAMTTTALAATSASAAITFELEDVRFIDGSQMTGTFTVSDDLSDILAFDFVTGAGSSPWGHFTGNSYSSTDASSIWWVSAQGLQAQFSNPTAQINFYFSSPLTADGTGLDATTSETVSGIGTRHLDSGSITAAVPEPATWAILLTGFGAVGLAMRRRRTSMSVVAA